MPLLKLIAVAVAALLLAPAVRAWSASPFLADRFSIGGIAPRPAAPPPFTLLEPAWLLPPLESLETSAARAGQILREDGAAAAVPLDSHRSSGGPVSYSLSEDLTAQLRYRHSQLSQRGRSRALRDEESTAFSTRPDRDVLDLNMSWHLAGNTLGFGYQFQSARGGSGPGEVGISRFLPGSQQATHSLTLGFTRQWGGADTPPVLIEPPLLWPDLDVAVAAATPTPVP